MSRYGKHDSITEAELDLLSPFAGFGPHESQPPAQTTEETSSTLKSRESHVPSQRNHLIQTKRGKYLPKLWGGWRTGVALGALCALIVLTINVSILIWVKAKYHVPNSGSAKIFEGSCSKKTKISVWCHLAINVCSTLLLSASNNAMQVLSAPTRANIDKAHARSGRQGEHTIRLVEYCLAESIEPHCIVTFNVFLLLIAVICNAVKAAALLTLLFLPGFKPLITVGDAIASFLTYPDQITAKDGAPAIAQDGSWTPPVLSTHRYHNGAAGFAGRASGNGWWEQSSKHLPALWSSAAKLGNELNPSLRVICIWLPALAILLSFKGESTFNAMWNNGFRAVPVDSVVKVTSSMVGIALLSNSPQLFLSMVYVSLNLLITSMIMTSEYNDFAVERKPLRVSEPKS
ncbi:hypothetical protein ACLMJK_008029 [Lecanora helva]